MKPQVVCHFLSATLNAPRAASYLLTHACSVSPFVQAAGPESCVVYPLMATDLKSALGVSGVSALPPAHRIRIARDVAAGLAALHRARRIHRDVKPSNVLLAADGRALLSDFGLARELADGASFVHTRVAGTDVFLDPAYMHSDGELRPNSDMYSFGITLLQARGPPYLTPDCVLSTLG